MSRGLTLNQKLLIRLECLFPCVLFLMRLTHKRVLVICLENFPTSSAVSHGPHLIVHLLRTPLDPAKKFPSKDQHENVTPAHSGTHVPAGSDPFALSK